MGQVDYHIDNQRQLRVTRGVVWPCLRIIPNDTTGSLIKRYGPEAEPVVSVDGSPVGPMVVERALLDGTLTILGRMGADLAVTRCTFPSPEHRCAIDRWTLRNTGKTPQTLTVAPLVLRQNVPGPYVTNHCEVISATPASKALAPGQELTFTVLFRCTPRLPDGWPRMALRSIRAFNRTWDLVVERKDKQMRVTVEQAGKRVFDRIIHPGTAVDVVLP